MNFNGEIVIPKGCEFLVSVLSFHNNDTGNDEWIKRTVYAKSHSAARYQMYKQLIKEEIIDSFDGYKVFQRSKFTIKKIGIPKLKSLYQSGEDLARTAKYRGLGFVMMGMKVQLKGHGFGYIIGANSSSNFNVYFPEKDIVDNCHPHWKMIYYDIDDTIIKDYIQKK